jgi:hypothetical protein
MSPCSATLGARPFERLRCDFNLLKLPSALLFCIIMIYVSPHPMYRGPLPQIGLLFMMNVCGETSPPCTTRYPQCTTFSIIDAWWWIVNDERDSLGKKSVLFILKNTVMKLHVFLSSPVTRHGGAWGERRYSSYSFTTSALGRGEWSASRPGRAFTPGERTPVPIVQEAGWAPEPIWTQRLEEKPFAPAGDRTPIARSSSP